MSMTESGLDLRVKALEKYVAELAAKERERRRKAGPQRAEDSYTEAKWQGKTIYHNPNNGH